MKVCVIGGGSTYTPELAGGFIEYHSELPVQELCLMDIDEQRLHTVGGFIRRMFAHAGLDIRVELTTDLTTALECSDFVITQIRVGGLAARELDERIPLRHGVIGQETTGPGGWAKALRTIPVILDIAQCMKEMAPTAWLINFTNPSGLITEAICRHSDVRVIGLCNVPVNTIKKMADLLGVAPEDVKLDYVGLNHLSWVRGVAVGGKDVSPQVMEKLLSDEKPGHDEDNSAFLRTAIQLTGLIPGRYLRYYYAHDKMLETEQSASVTRAREVMQIRDELLLMYTDPTLKEKPALLAKRGGALYSQAAVSLISAIACNKSEVHIVNVPNCGAIPDIPYEAVAELPCLIDAAGAHPLMSGHLPAVARGLVQAVKAYEELTVQAAVTGDEHCAVQALLAHPLVGKFELAQALWRDIKPAHPKHLAYFDQPHEE